MLDREPTVHGRFYPADPRELKSDILERLNKAKSTPQKNLVAIASPHAGYVFSGDVAAESYNAVRDGDYETIVLISPSHRIPISFNSVLTEGSYSTPLGKIPVDTHFAKQLEKNGKSIRSSTQGHESASNTAEHSLEVQLPFLQVIFNDSIQIVPIIMGDQSLSSALDLGNAISEAAKDKKVLIIASTDLSHYHTDDDARKIDSHIIDAIRRFSWEDVDELIISHKSEACGSGPVMAAMVAAQKMGANSARILKYATSAESPFGDKRQVVGYVAASLAKVDDAETENISDETSKAGKQRSPDQIHLDLETKKQLIKFAWEEIRSILLNKKNRIIIDSSQFEGEWGVFVTLTTKNGTLRGCIGFIESLGSLQETLATAARSAATRDPRFPQVTPNELDNLTLEVSLLSPPFPIESNDVIPGKHGLIIEKGWRRGLLLPQVPVKYGWDRETYLKQTCVKAGLPIDAWKNPNTKLQAFTAIVIDETKL